MCDKNQFACDTIILVLVRAGHSNKFNAYISSIQDHQIMTIIPNSIAALYIGISSALIVIPPLSYNVATLSNISTNPTQHNQVISNDNNDNLITD